MYLKAEKTQKYYALWKNGSMESEGFTVTIPFPDSPSREMNLRTVSKNKVKTHGNRKGLIHSVVHAEGYAIDLMWDLMGRFHHLKLPVEFYDDWIQVAYEESCHFLDWANRLRELDSYYGEFEVHDGLWQSALDTKDDILERLALVHGVFEARGLDVFPNAWKKFEKAKDSISKAILVKNHHEEITHVKAGLKWFTYLCKQQHIEPIPTFHRIVRSKYVGLLKPPFNTSAREKAGMSPEWYLPLSHP